MFSFLLLMAGRSREEDRVTSQTLRNQGLFQAPFGSEIGLHLDLLFFDLSVST